MVDVPCSPAELRGNQVATITEWLAPLGMSEYAQRFADNRIDDVSILRDLTDQDLKDIGVPLGHRRKMLRAIAEMVDAAPTRMPSAPAPEPNLRDDAERRQLTVMFTDLVGILRTDELSQLAAVLPGRPVRLEEMARPKVARKDPHMGSLRAAPSALSASASRDHTTLGRRGESYLRNPLR